MRTQLRNKSCLIWIGMIWAAVGGSTVMGEDRTDAYNLTGPQAIKAVLIAQVEAWNAHDIEMFMETYWNSESLSFSSGGKTTLGWKATLERYQNRYPDGGKMGRLRFENLEIEMLSPSSAYVLGEWHLKRKSEDMDGNFTLVFRFIEGHWKIVHDHSSLREEEASPEE